jgi:hypothetical protein
VPNNTTGLRNRTLTDIRAVLRVHHPGVSKLTKEPIPIHTHGFQNFEKKKQITTCKPAAIL